MSIISSMSIFYNIVNCIQPETTDPFIHPELDHPVQLFPKRRIFPVQIRLHYTETVIIIFLNLRHPFPGASSKECSAAFWRLLLRSFLPDVKTWYLLFRSFLASRNHGCRWELWFKTRSIMTTISRFSQAAISSSSSSICPLLPLLYNSHWHHIHCRN